MRLHLDTSFLIDWRRHDPRIEGIVGEIARGEHDISVDPIVEIEFFSGSAVAITATLLFRTVLAMGTRLEITPEVSQLAARWLAPMDEAKRRAHFADAVIAACAAVAGATLVTGDRRIGRVFRDAPVMAY